MGKEKHASEIELINKDGKPTEIPIGGSLELLALGDVGLLAWRQKRKQARENRGVERNEPE